MKPLLSSVAMVLAAVLCASCVYDDKTLAGDTRATYIELSLNMPLASAAAPTGYENGNYYENAISNYQVFFYDLDDTFICSLDNKVLTATDSEEHTTYTITALLTDDDGYNPLAYTGGNFKVVMIANWETTVSPAVGSTIADLCNGSEGQYSYLDHDDLDLTTFKRYLPYFGVHTYNNVSFKTAGTTQLAGTLTLLRAVAKVEIIIVADDDDDDHVTLSSATLHHFNKRGYCAPADVSGESDYGQAQDWASDYTAGAMHLVNSGANDGDATGNTLELFKEQERQRDANGTVTQREKWIGYLPEYDNSGDDYAYLSVVFSKLSAEEEEYNIYFAVYDDDGTTRAYDADATAEERAKRRSILRNNLYRYNVSVNQGKVYVVPDAWEYVFDNWWTFGNSEAEVIGYQFTANGISYEVTSSTAGNPDGGIDADPDAPLTVKTITGTGTAYEANVYIPSEILYYGFTYTVTEIGAHTFDGHDHITSISLPSTIESIGDDAFEGCTALVSIYLHATNPPSCGDDLFAMDNTENITLYVPYGTTKVYEDDEVWGKFGFKEITAIPD